jgi:hypothetical protein
MVFFAWVRVKDEKDSNDIFYVLVVTLGAAAAAILCGSIAFYRKNQHRHVRTKMFDCQVWNAIERHGGDGQVLREKYQLEVERLWRTRKPETRTP